MADKEMDAAAWAVLIIAIILAVLLSTIGKWFKFLGKAIGNKLAWLIASIIIAILVITLVALLCTNPDAIDRIVNMAVNNIERVAEGASQILNGLLGDTLSTIGRNIFTLGALAVGGLLIYKFLGGSSDKAINYRK